MNKNISKLKIVVLLALSVVGIGGLDLAVSHVIAFQAFVNDAPASAAQSSITAPNSDSGIKNSLNWSGYAATGGTFSGVGGSWNVPKINNPANFSADAVWVGIGGTGSRDLIQAGTQALIDPNGNTAYQAWYETLPGTSRPVPLSVKPGDSVTVSIINQGNNSWNISITNNTTGQNFQATKQYASTLSSAEWVVEMVNSRAGFVPLDNFGSVQFTNGWTTKNGTNIGIQQANPQMISMINQNGQVLATPSPIADSNSGFSVARSDVNSTSSVAFASTFRRRHVWFRFD